MQEVKSGMQCVKTDEKLLPVTLHGTL